MTDCCASNCPKQAVSILIIIQITFLIQGMIRSFVKLSRSKTGLKNKRKKIHKN